MIGNPLPEGRLPPLPPLTITEEYLYIGRYTLLDVNTNIFTTVHYAFDFVIPDYNPEWVSIDVVGTNFAITNGHITHECLPKPPPNDDCGDAQLITPSYPQVVMGTTLAATIDCPDYLEWDAVWYEIELPYEYNFIELDLCLDEIWSTIINTGIILMPDCSCEEESTIYSTDEWDAIGNCINDLNFFVNGPGTVYYPVMTEPKGNFTFDINVTEYFFISGKLTYKNSVMSPMELTEVTLDDGIDTVSKLTDLNGDYEFAYLPPGTYTLGGISTNPRGGTEQGDINLVKDHILGSPLTGLQFLAADVNNDTFINIGDLNLMIDDISGVIPGYPSVPDWFFENSSVIITTGNISRDFLN